MALAGQPIDAESLAAAIENEAAGPGEMDFRTRLLIRDSLLALEKHWVYCENPHQRCEAIRGWRNSPPTIGIFCMGHRCRSDAVFPHFLCKAQAKRNRMCW
jgi:hypothetical protein